MVYPRSSRRSLDRLERAENVSFPELTSLDNTIGGLLKKSANGRDVLSTGGNKRRLETAHGSDLVICAVFLSPANHLDHIGLLNDFRRLCELIDADRRIWENN